MSNSLSSFPGENDDLPGGTPMLPWLTDFVRDELRPFLLGHREYVLARLGTWSGVPAEHRNMCDPYPLPPPTTRDVTLDECCAALVAVHDTTREQRERIGPNTNNWSRTLDGLPLSAVDRLRYQIAILSATVPSLSAAVLPGLRAMLEKVKAAVVNDSLAFSVNPAETRSNGANEKVNDADPWPDYMSAADLAAKLGLLPEATRKKLERLAKKHDCYITNESPRRGEAKRLYRVADVLSFLSRPR